MGSFSSPVACGVGDPLPRLRRRIRVLYTPREPGCALPRADAAGPPGVHGELVLSLLQTASSGRGRRAHHPLQLHDDVAILMYMKRVSVAEARNRLPSLIHEAEREPVEIVRRGKPVAVLMSRGDFDRLPPRPSFYEALMAWREKNKEQLDDEDWLPPRDTSPGRKPPRW